MLELDVDKRLTASQALAHPFFELFRDPEEETEAPQPFDDSLEHEKLTVDEWKRKSRGPWGAGLSLLCPLCFQTRPRPALLDPHCCLLSELVVSCMHFLLPELTSAPRSIQGGGLSFTLSTPYAPRASLCFAEHIYKEIVNFSPVARKDSRRRSGMKLQ